jgi:hypothetical protein
VESIAADSYPEAKKQILGICWDIRSLATLSYRKWSSSSSARSVLLIVIGAAPSFLNQLCLACVPLDAAESNLF